MIVAIQLWLTVMTCFCSHLKPLLLLPYVRAYVLKLLLRAVFSGIFLTQTLHFRKSQDKLAELRPWHEKKSTIKTYKKSTDLLRQLSGWGEHESLALSVTSVPASNDVIDRLKNRGGKRGRLTSSRLHLCDYIETWTGKQKYYIWDRHPPHRPDENQPGGKPVEK